MRGNDGYFGVNPDFPTGQSFRLLFVTSDSWDATSSNIADYNPFVQNQATAAGAPITAFNTEFRALISTNTVTVTIGGDGDVAATPACFGPADCASG